MFGLFLFEIQTLYYLLIQLRYFFENLFWNYLHICDPSASFIITMYDDELMNGDQPSCFKDVVWLINIDNDTSRS